MDTFEDWLRAFTDDFRRFKRYLETAHSREVRWDQQHYVWGKMGGGGSMNTTFGGQWEDWGA